MAYKHKRRTKASVPVAYTMADEIRDLGGPAFVEDFIGSGGTVLDLAKRLNVHRQSVYNFLKINAEYAAIMPNARAAAADAMADEALAIADNLLDPDITPTLTKEVIGATKLRLDTRKWLAGAADPMKYGNRNTPAVQINIGTLHLDVMRKRATDPADLMRVIEAAALPDEDDTDE